MANEPSAGPRLETLAFLEYQGSPAGSITRAQPSEGITLTSRDNYRVVVNRAAEYTYIFQESGGKIWKLFPNPQWSPRLANPLPPEANYMFPSATEWYYLDQEIGEESLYVVSSRVERVDLESMFSARVNVVVGDTAGQLRSELVEIIGGQRDDAICNLFKIHHAKSQTLRSLK